MGNDSCNARVGEDNISIYANKYNDIIRMYEEIYRMLKRGGKIFSSVFSKNTPGYNIA